MGHDPPVPVRFSPGTAVALVGPHSSIILATSATSPLIARLRALVIDAACRSITDLIDALTSDGIVTLPSLACVVLEHDHVRVLVRGEGAVVVFRADGFERIDSGQATAWNERVVDGPDRLELIAQKDDGLAASCPYEVRTGVVPAERVVVTVAASAPIDLQAEQARAEASSLHEHDPLTVFSDHPASEPLASSATRSVDDPASATSGGAGGDDSGPLPDPGAPAVESVAAAVPETDGDVGADQESAFEFAHLLGDTQYTGAEHAAVRAEPAEDERPGIAVAEPDDQNGAAQSDTDVHHAELTRSYETINSPEGPASAGVPITSDHDGATSHASGTDDEEPHPNPRPMIERVPGITPGVSRTDEATPNVATVPPIGAPPPEVEPQPVLATGTDEVVELDPMTVAVSARRQPAAGDVQAVRCPAGHLNQPHADRCRVCLDAIHEHDVISAPRPTLGVLRFHDGRTVEVNGSMLVGRQPEPLPGSEPHTLVTVDDPDRVLSRNHLEVRVNDWHVELVDLGSMNHTFVEAPGRPPIQLRPNEPSPMVHDTIVNMGDAITFAFERPDA